MYVCHNNDDVFQKLTNIIMPITEGKECCENTTLSQQMNMNKSDPDPDYLWWWHSYVSMSWAASVDNVDISRSGREPH